MSNVTTLETPETTAAAPVIVATPRGPCLADRQGLTIYPIFEYLQLGLSHERIRHDFGLTPEQLDAMLHYIADHAAEVEQAYADIVRYSETLRARYEPASRARSSFSPGMSRAEKDALLRQKLAQKLSTAPHENNHPA